MGRTRIRWDNARELMIALPDKTVAQQAAALVEEANALAKKAEAARRNAESLVYDALGLDNATARKLIEAFKPPK
jgi:hypothetical protein